MYFGAKTWGEKQATGWPPNLAGWSQAGEPAGGLRLQGHGLSTSRVSVSSFRGWIRISIKTKVVRQTRG